MKGMRGRVSTEVCEASTIKVKCCLDNLASHRLYDMAKL